MADALGVQPAQSTWFIPFSLETTLKRHQDKSRNKTDEKTCWASRLLSRCRRWSLGRNVPSVLCAVWATESSTWSVQRAAPSASPVPPWALQWPSPQQAAHRQPAPLHCLPPRAVALSSSGSLPWGCRTLHVWGPHTTRGHVVAGCTQLRGSPRGGDWPDTRCRSGELTPP